MDDNPYKSPVTTDAVRQLWLIRVRRDVVAMLALGILLPLYALGGLLSVFDYDTPAFSFSALALLAIFFASTISLIAYPFIVFLRRRKFGLD